MSKDRQPQVITVAHHTQAENMLTEDPWRSERLIYRAPEADSDEDKAFYTAIYANGRDYANASAMVPKPQNKKSVENYFKYLEDSTLIAVVACLPSDDPAGKPTPVGEIHLRGGPASHHRNASIGVQFLRAHQGKGYGSEAIRWIVDWGFRYGGLHRIGIGCFGYNTGARRLYERLGFKLEGVTREQWFHDGKFWDGYSLGMLQSEWEAIKAKGLEAEEATSQDQK